MSNFSALIATIQANIKTNGNEEITGAVLQDVLEAMVQALGTEAINNLETALGNEETARQNADGTLQNNIDAEALRAGTAEAGLGGRLDTIEAEIPSAASSSNKLADKAFVTNLTDALQAAVNGIKSNIDNGYVYAGIATPSGTPASGKVFYLAITAGTYTNYGALVVTQGINILKNNGTAWSQEQLIALDNTPTPSSSGLVKSGGVFEVIMTNGSAFDLTVHNSGTTYADLSAALIAMDSLPAAYKKGGMSIKFVQTSDNKYVQWRLMKNTWSATETDWQGVDDVPTAGSHNLVESGSVYEFEYLNNSKYGNYLINNTNLLMNTAASLKYIGAAHVKTTKQVIVKGFTIYTKAAGSVRIISYDIEQDAISNIEYSEVIQLVSGLNTVKNLNFLVQEGKHVGIENYSGTSGLIPNYGNSSSSPEIKTTTEYFGSDLSRQYLIENNSISVVYDIEDYYSYMHNMGDVDYYPVMPFTINNVSPYGTIYTPVERSACYIKLRDELYKEEIDAVNVYCQKDGTVTICRGTRVGTDNFVETELVSSKVINGWNRIVLKQPVVLSKADKESIGVRGTDNTVAYWMDGQVGFMQYRNGSWNIANQTIGLIPLNISNAPALYDIKANRDTFDKEREIVNGEVLNTKYGSLLLGRKNLTATGSSLPFILLNRKTVGNIVIRGFQCFSMAAESAKIRLFYSSSNIDISGRIESAEIDIKPGMNIVDNVNFSVPSDNYIGLTNPLTGCVPHLGGSSGESAGIPSSEHVIFFNSEGVTQFNIDYCSIPVIFYTDDNPNSLSFEHFNHSELTGLEYKTDIGNVDFEPIGQTDISHVIMYGQSLSVGADAHLALTTVPITGNYMIGNNVHDYNHEVLTPLSCGDGYEDPVIGLVNSISQIARRMYKDIDFIATSSGYGARTVAQLSKPSRYEGSGISYQRNNDGHTVKHYEVFETHLTMAKALADAADKSISASAIIYMQGEQDYTAAVQSSDGSNLSCDDNKALYKERVIQLKEDMQASVMSIYGQTRKPMFFIAPIGGNFVSKWDMAINMAQVELALENDDIFLLNPTYSVTDHGANSHLTSNGYRWWGELAAKSVYNAVLKDMRVSPPVPYKVSIKDNKVYIACYAKQLPLVIDTHTVEPKNNYGFAIKANDGDVSIRYVSIIKDLIIIECDKNLSGEVEISYAGSTRNGSGNICDSDRWKSMYKYAEDTGDEPIGYVPKDINGNSIVGKDYPMQNWMVNFYYKLTV